MYVFFLDILLHPLTPLLVMTTRRWCDRLGARRGRERWECYVVVERVFFSVGWGLVRKSILRQEAREMMCG